jgi:hypothetical protein
MAAIEGVGRTGAVRPGTRGPRRASADFTVPDEATVASHAATEAAPAAALASMLTLQEVGGDAAEDREARRHGQDLLAALADLQRALLIGNDDAAARSAWPIWPLRCRTRPIAGSLRLSRRSQFASRLSWRAATSDRWYNHSESAW